MSEQKETSGGDIVIHPHYQTAHAQITEPTRFVAMSHYYRRRWLREVGPVGTAILLELRGRCYNNPTTGERRDTVVAAQKELAEAIGISVDTLQRQLGRPGQDEDLKANAALRRFIWAEERYQRSEVGRVRQLENIYHVSMDDPIHEGDEERLEALVEEYERQAQEAAVRHQHRRKQILPAQEKAPLPAASTPEPQNAVLSGESLLLLTEEITSSSTFNVREDEIDFVSPAEEIALPNSGKLRNALEDGLNTQVNALVQELKDRGSERRHKQLLSICEQKGLLHLSRQALQATRHRLARETKRGVVEKPGAYYQRILISLLEAHQVFVPTAGEDDAEDVRRLARQSLGLEG